jgi:hypothetical protein
VDALYGFSNASVVISDATGRAIKQLAIKQQENHHTQKPPGYRFYFHQVFNNAPPMSGSKLAAE